MIEAVDMTNFIKCTKTIKISIVLQEKCARASKKEQSFSNTSYQMTQVAGHSLCTNDIKSTETSLVFRG